MISDETTEEYATVEMTGNPLKRWLKHIGYLGRSGFEVRLKLTASQLHVSSVDPANVGMIQTRLNYEAFDSFDVHKPAEVGVNVSELLYALRRGRVNSDDTTQVTITDNEFGVEVSRGYEFTSLTSRDTVVALDPESVRESAEIPDLEREYSANVEADAFIDGMEHVLEPRETEHVQIHSDGGDVALTGKGRGTQAVFETIETDAPADANALYSEDYMGTLVEMVKKMKSPKVRIIWGEEIPASFQFDTEHTTTTFTVAPRITDR